MAAPATLTEIERATLEHCHRQDGTSLSSLRRFGKTAKHGAANRLAERGLLEHIGHGLWRTTDAGVRLLGEAGPSDADPITTMWPPIALLPSEALTSHARLFILAVVARTRELATSHLPWFPVYAPTLAGKSSYGRITCHRHGVPPEHGIIDCGAEVGKSVSVRRTGTGAIATIRKAMAGPVIVFDEFHRAAPEVRRWILVYLSGERRTAFENETLDIAATSLVLFNPRAPRAAGIEKRTGLDETLLRRAIPLDLEAVPFPSSWRTEGAKVLEAVARAPPIRLPEGIAPVPVVREDIARALDRIVRPEFGRWVDVELVYVLCLAAAHLGIADPVMYVIVNYATVVETVGWVRDGWRDALSGRALAATPPPPDFEPSPLGKEVIAVAGDSATVSSEARTAAFDRLSASLAMSPAEVVARLRRDVDRENAGLTEAVLDEFNRHMQEKGRDPQGTAERVGKLVAKYVKLETAVEAKQNEYGTLKARYDALARAAEARGGFDLVRRADPVLKMMDRLGFSIYDAENILKSFLNAAKASGVSPADAGKGAIEAVREHADAHGAVKDHVRKVDALKAEVAAKERVLRELDAAADNARARRDRAEAVRRVLETEGTHLKEGLRGLATEYESLREGLEEAMGTAKTVDEAMLRARERERAADEKVHACEERTRTLDARETCLAEREAALDAREARLAETEEDIDAVRVALHVLWGAAGGRGAPSARAFRRLADWSERGHPELAMTAILEPERMRKGVLRLARPHIEKHYVTRSEHERVVGDLRFKLAAKDSKTTGGASE